MVHACIGWVDVTRRSAVAAVSRATACALARARAYRRLQGARKAKSQVSGRADGCLDVLSLDGLALLGHQTHAGPPAYRDERSVGSAAPE